MNNPFDQDARHWDAAAYRRERARIIAEAIKTQVRLPQGYRGMDFGCGTGLLGFQFAPEAGEFTFIDTSEGMIQEVRRKIDDAGLSGASAVLLDLTGEETAGRFDLIVSLMTLHHIDDSQGMIRKLTALLAPSGYLCLADLVTEDGTFHEDKEVPHHGFDPTHLGKILEQAGQSLVSTTVPWEGRKILDGEERVYPVFLSVSRKPAEFPIP